MARAPSVFNSPGAGRALRAAALWLTVAVTGCAAQPTPIPEAQTGDARVYAAVCGACHSVPHPRRHTMDRWRQVLDLMNHRIEEQGRPPLSEAETASIHAYLERHAKK